MKKIILLALTAFALLPTTALAQEEKDNKVEAYVQAGLVSHYMWRGTDMTDGICIQPEAGISWQGLSLSASGSAGFTKEEYKEINVSLGYERWGVNIGVTDYWASDVDPANRYFFFKEKETAHQLEANLGYTCKYFSLQANTMFWGNDYKINGDRAYSTYIELSVPFRLAGLDWLASAGITPMESAGYTTSEIVEGLIRDVTVTTNHYFYGESFTCNMAALRATKTLEFKHLEVPIFAEIHTNPYLQKATFLVGVALKVF
jgi:hypothetical protein